MQKLCQLGMFAATAALVAACSTTPPGSDGTSAATERVCVEEHSASGSRLSRRVCRTVEKETEEKTDRISDD